MMSTGFRLIVAVLAAGTLAACGPSASCSSEKEAAAVLAKLSADVQEATLKNKLSMTKLRELTIRVDTAGSHYSAKKDHAQFCKDLEELRSDFGL
jgi:hypothetical protein